MLNLRHRWMAGEQPAPSSTSTRFLRILVLLVASTCIFVHAQSGNMEFVSDSRLGEGLEIVQVGSEQPLPAALQPVVDTLPVGSFLLVNRTDKLVTAVVTVWTFRSASGETEQRRINCDSYFGAATDPIVAKQSLSLITTGGCIPENQFGSVSRRSGLGASFTALHETRTNAIASVRVSVDSVIFADGEIRGTDKFKYYEVIGLRYDALQSLLSDVRSAAGTGESVKDRVRKIRNEEAKTSDKWSNKKVELADLVLRSPNPDGTIKFLSSQPSLPDFHHHFEERN